jgi:hypothetical protein
MMPPAITISICQIQMLMIMRRRSYKKITPPVLRRAVKFTSAQEMIRRHCTFCALV